MGTRVKFGDCQATPYLSTIQVSSWHTPAPRSQPPVGDSAHVLSIEDLTSSGSPTSPPARASRGEEEDEEVMTAVRWTEVTRSKRMMESHSKGTASSTCGWV